MSGKSTASKLLRGPAVFALALSLIFFARFQNVRAESSEVIGDIPWLLSASGAHSALYEECSLGDAAADAVLRAAGSDIAIVNGGDLGSNLTPGAITLSRLEEGFTPGRTLAVTEITPSGLVRLLESAVSHVTVSGRGYDAPASAFGGFPQIAGFQFTYDPGAAPGQRIVRLKIGGTPVELDDSTTVLKLACTVHMLSGGYDLPPAEEYQTLSCTLTEAMADYIGSGLDDYSLPANRIRAIGISENTIPVGYLAAMCFVIAAIAGIWGRSSRKRKRTLAYLREADAADAALKEQQADPEEKEN